MRYRPPVPPKPEFLPPTTYAVLGLLSLGQELSGYDVRQWALRSLKFFYWTPAQSHVYRELRRLEELALATSRDVPQEGRPGKRLFAITPAGREELARWVNEAPVAPPMIKFDGALRLFFAHAARPGRIEEILEEHREAVQATLDELDEVRAMLAAGGPPEDASPDRVRWRVAELVAVWGQDHWRGELNALRKLRRDLAERPSGTPAPP